MLDVWLLLSLLDCLRQCLSDGIYLFLNNLAFTNIFNLLRHLLIAQLHHSFFTNSLNSNTLSQNIIILFEQLNKILDD
jgi:hypothetical protein